MSPRRPTGDKPYGTPDVLPVDTDYRITRAGRAGLHRRQRYHGFDLLAPALDREVEGAYVPRSCRFPGVTAHELNLRRPLRLAPGEAVGLPRSPRGVGGLVGAEVRGEGRARVCVSGEPLPGKRRASWRLRPPLFGTAALIAGPRPAVVEGLTLWTHSPAAWDVLDRFALHAPARVEREYRLPLSSLRQGQRVDQVAIHWGSVEYQHPDRTRPLVAWGYPYYLDGVLGDVDAVFRGHRQSLARGKFLEFDEVENIRCEPAIDADAVIVHLRRRELLVPPPVCRFAAIEVRYQTPPGPTPVRVAVNRWVKKGQFLDLPIPNAGRLLRLDVIWSDRGPAMGAISVGAARSRFVNVCSGERRVFAYLYGARSREVRLHAREADIKLEAVEAYFTD